MNKKTKIGIVLGGGGGKGAYQTGVLKALEEAGILPKIKFMSGTSIGALNMAMYLSGGLEKCEQIWENVNMDIALSKKKVKEIFLKKSLFSRQGMINMAKENIDFTKVKNANIKVFAMATPLGRKNKDAKSAFMLNGRDEEQILDILLASSAIPYVFESVNIEGVNYADGYGVDNVPVSVLKEQGCDLIFVVPLKDKSDAFFYGDKDTTVVDFVSKYNDYGFIDGTLDFKPERAKMRIEHGYEVGKQLINKLIEEKVIAITYKQKISKKWDEWKKRKNPTTKNYYALSKEEIEHLPKGKEIKKDNIEIAKENSKIPTVKSEKKTKAIKKEEGKKIIKVLRKR